jgi:hypothetical protein
MRDLCSKVEDGEDSREGSKADNNGTEEVGLSEEQKEAMIRDLLSSSSKEEDKEVNRKITDNLARARSKRDAMIRGLLSNSS